MDSKQEIEFKTYIDAIDNSGLLPNGYSLYDKGIEVSDKVTAYTAYKLTYLNKDVSREFYLSITDYYTHSRAFISIQNIDGESHSILSVTDYLKKFCHIKNVQESNLLNNYRGNTTSEKLLSFLTWLKEVVDNRFFMILEGEAWEEIPFDWGPYK